MASHGHGHGDMNMTPEQQAAMQQEMRQRQMQQMAQRFQSDKIVPTPEGEEVFEVTGQHAMQLQMMSQMMQKMVAGATGLAFSQMQGSLSEEQRAVSSEAMEKAKLAETTMQGSGMMERAMGKVLLSLSEEQKDGFKKRVDSYIADHVPDDTTRCLLLLGIRVRQEELKTMALTTDEHLQLQMDGQTKSHQIMMAAIDPATGMPTEEAQKEAQKVVDETNAKLDEIMPPEAVAGKENFLKLHKQYQNMQYYQTRVSTSMKNEQMQIMGRAQMEAQQKETMAEKSEVAARFNKQLHNSFSAEQARHFLKFRSKLVEAGVGEYLDASITALAEHRLTVPEPEPEPEAEAGWGSWLGSAATAVGGVAAGAAGAVGAVASSIFLEDDEASAAMQQQAAQARVKMLTVDGFSLDFEPAGFGERQASIVNCTVVRCEPWTCATALSNAAALKGNIGLCGRGDCGFVDKARACQMAGVVGMIVVNNEDVLGKLVGSGDDIAIPCVCVKSTDGEKFQSDSVVTLRM